MITIIVPSYNEEENIENTVKELRKLSLDEEFEVMVVDDGSNDKTTELAEKAGADQVIHYTPNQGKGYAMRKGAKEANGEKIIFTDADQHQIEKLPRFLKELEPGTLVTGKRNFNKVPWPRRVNNALAKLAVLLATGKKVEDAICGIRAVYREDFLDLGLEKDGFEVESEINLKAISRGMEMKYIPVEIDYPPKSFKFNELGWSKSFKLGTYLAKSVLRSWTTGI